MMVGYIEIPANTIEEGVVDGDRSPYKSFPESSCAECRQKSPVSHNGSRLCRSFSIAAGGHRTHCSCDTCY
jgi:hypothetical protein